MKSNIFTKIFLGSIIAPLLLLTTGCTEEDFGFDQPRPATGGLTLTMSCNDMLPQYVDPAPISRAGGPKDDDEKRINTLHLFFFDAETGKLLEPDKGNINFPPYQVLETNVITIPEDAFTQMTNVRIVAIANINGTDNPGQEGDGNKFLTEWTPGGRIENGTRDTGTPYLIDNYSKLQKWVYAPKLRTAEGISLSQLPTAGMPMIGFTSEPINLNEAYNGQNRRDIQLTALMAKVNITVKLTPNQESLDGSLPSMTIRSYGIKNMPTTVCFEKPDVENLTEESLTTAEMEEEIEVTLDAPITINKDSERVSFTYYTYENIQLPDYSATRPGGGEFFPGGTTKPVYPENVDPDDYQRWKPTMARKDRASAMILRGNYITHQGLNYNAQFTIYIGANPNNDFKVERNHEYNNNITVRGLDYVRNSDDNVYNFDARVNVTTDNPLYLAIVNERKVDAHAAALPMDVWLLLREPAGTNGENPEGVNHNTTVTIEIPDDCDWISMTMIPRAEMQRKSFTAGAGAEPYFYENMIDYCNNGTVFNLNTNLSDHDPIGLDYGRTVTITSTPTLNNSRSRVYFYIDENVKPDADGNVPDRYADIRITYTNDKDGGDRRERILQIEQRGLVNINGNWEGNNGETAEINTYMEYYEEYLEHNDPLDQHLQPGAFYEGLPWGLKGITLYNVTGLLPNPPGFDVYYTNQAFAYTQAVLSRNGADPLSNLYLFNETKPTSAFHYCYGRNKRNTDGTVAFNKTNGWYMPGIRELERALVQYYLTFEDFRGNLYLSAACGKGNGLTDRSKERTELARATRVDMVNGKPKYVDSTEGNPGAVYRDNPHRIRAFYRM